MCLNLIEFCCFQTRSFPYLSTAVDGVWSVWYWYSWHVLIFVRLYVSLSFSLSVCLSVCPRHTFWHLLKSIKLTQSWNTKPTKEPTCQSASSSQLRAWLGLRVKMSKHGYNCCCPMYFLPPSPGIPDTPCLSCRSSSSSCCNISLLIGKWIYYGLHGDRDDAFEVFVWVDGCLRNKLTYVRTYLTSYTRILLVLYLYLRVSSKDSFDRSD